MTGRSRAILYLLALLGGLLWTVLLGVRDEHSVHEHTHIYIEQDNAPEDPARTDANWRVN